MFRLVKKFTLLSVLILSTNCQNNSQVNTGSTKTDTTASTWTAEDLTAKYELTLTQKNDMNADFSEKVTQKSNSSTQDITGIINYNSDTKISTWTYSTPFSAIVKMSYVTSNNGNTYEYTITETNSASFTVNQKYTFIKK